MQPVNPYAVELVFEPASNLAVWTACERGLRYPPLPASWSHYARASCSCPAFTQEPAALKYVDASKWCKHVAAAFYIVALECDRDFKFIYRLSCKVPPIVAYRKRVIIDLLDSVTQRRGPTQRLR